MDGAVRRQGAEAGGHRGTFIGRFEDALIGTGTLVPQMVRATGRPVRSGEFGAMMDVELVNDGPVTLVLER